MDSQFLQLNFSTWFKWENRGDYPYFAYPGVYAIGIAANPNLENLPLNWADIVYIGMTQRSLRDRLIQFDRVIRGRKGFHSGASTVFKALGNYSEWNDALYVALMGVQCNILNPQPEDYRQLGWVAYLEYEAFAHFHTVNKRLPRYNTKHNIE